MGKITAEALPLSYSGGYQPKRWSPYGCPHCLTDVFGFYRPLGMRANLGSTGEDTRKSEEEYVNHNAYMLQWYSPSCHQLYTHGDSATAAHATLHLRDKPQNIQYPI